MSKHHHHHKKCQSCHKHSPHYHKHCHHHHHKHHDHHHHKRHCYHHKRYYRHHIVCPPTPPTPTITYRCSGLPNYECGPVLDGTGYATLELCQTACATPGILLLGTAANFRVLAHETITNVDGTTIDGNLGLTPGTSVTGFPPGVITGGSFVGPLNATANQAQADLTTAWNEITATPATTDLTGFDLGGMILAPGVYNYDTSAGLTGNLILDAVGNSSAVWIFKIGSTLTTAANSTVSVINSGIVDNVFWQVGSSATLGIDSQIAGNILAQASITITTGAVVNGRALARTAAVTLDTNTVGP